MKKDIQKLIFLLAIVILTSEILFTAAFIVWALQKPLGK
jgi:hypothetical protein